MTYTEKMLRESTRIFNLRGATRMATLEPTEVVIRRGMDAVHEHALALDAERNK